MSQLLDAPITRYGLKPGFAWLQPEPPRKLFALTAIIRQDDDRYTVFVPILPGAVTFGESPEDAKKSIREAAQGVIESYLAKDGNIPWRRELRPEDQLATGDVAYAFMVDA